MFILRVRLWWPRQAGPIRIHQWHIQNAPRTVGFLWYGTFDTITVSCAVKDGRLACVFTCAVLYACVASSLFLLSLVRFLRIPEHGKRSGFWTRICHLNIFTRIAYMCSLWLVYNVYVCNIWRHAGRTYEVLRSTRMKKEMLRLKLHMSRWVFSVDAWDRQAHQASAAVVILLYVWSATVQRRKKKKLPLVLLILLYICSTRWIWHLFISRRCYAVYDLRRDRTFRFSTLCVSKGAYPPCCKIIHHLMHCRIDYGALSRHLEETVFWYFRHNASDCVPPAHVILCT